MFDKACADTARPVEVPCGRCMECRVAKQRSWAMRIMHESQTHEDNCFVTLTYENDPGTLVLRDVQLWLKRLRKCAGSFRYFLVGEYGKKLARPHYHAILFGLDFADRKWWQGDGINRLYRSEVLDNSWRLGFASVGTVTPASASYVAKYTTKKVTGERAREHYGERLPEFCVMSRNPGIGARWIDKFGPTGVFERDFVVTQMGSPVAVPPYYTKRQGDSVFMREVKAKRRMKLWSRKLESPEEFGGARLLAKQTVLEKAVEREAQERALAE